MPSTRATSIAAGREESGIGITTSISPSGTCFAIVAASFAPIRRRDS